MFKFCLAIGNAFAVLNDTEKRKQYDLYGPLEDQQSSMRRHSHRGNRYDYSRGFECMEDFSPEFSSTSRYLTQTIELSSRSKCRGAL